MLCGNVATIISVYGCQSGRNKNCFYDDLNADMHSKNENCIIPGYFNRYVGSLIDGYEGIHGKPEIEIEKDSLDFVDNFDMVVGNTFFKKDSEKLITFKSGVSSSVIDCVVAKKELMKRVGDVKIPGEERFSQNL